MKSFILLLALSSPLFARLGETMEQCVERYGEPISTHEKSIKFLKSGITIRADFHQDKVISISYNRKDSKLTSEEIDSLIETNLPNIKLTEENLDHTSIYKDEDQRYSVIKSKKLNYLIINDSKGLAAFTKEKEEKQKSDTEKSLKGF